MGGRVFITVGEDGAGDNDGSPSVYFCMKLSPQVLARASVLEALSDTEGMANLPDGISNDDFLLWQKSSLQAVPQSTSQLTRILQVADALADKRLPEWVCVLAQRVASTTWDSPESCEDIHCALLSLQHPIRYAVFRALISLVPPGEALLTLPPTLHASLTAALISPSGTLCHSTYRPPALQILLTHLPSLPASGQPALRSLDLSQPSLSPSSCHLLAHTLSTHTRLSSLHLHLTDSGAFGIECIAALSPTLPLASSLLSLSLAHTGLCESSLPHLTTVLSALRHLQSLAVATLIPPPCPTAVISPLSTCSAQTAPARAPDDAHSPVQRFMRAVATHPSLSSLSFAAKAIPFSHSHLPDVFPILRYLDLVFTYDACPAMRSTAPQPPPLRPGLPAPPSAPVQFPALTRLDFRLQLFCKSAFMCWPASAVQRILPLHMESVVCPEMRTLTLRTQPENALNWEDAVWNVLSGSIWPCPNLEDLSLDCDNAISAIHAVSCQLRRLTRLTSLILNSSSTETEPDAWAKFFSALAPLHTLQRLRLQPYHAASQGLTELLVEALRNFQKLTELSLDGRGTQYPAETPLLRCDVFATGLCGATALRVLGLHDLALVVPEDLWSALANLTLLQELRVSFCQIESPEATEIAAVLPRLTALGTLCLDGNRLLGSGVLAVARALRRMPRLRLADLSMNEIDELFDEEIAAVQQELAVHAIKLIIDAPG